MANPVLVEVVRGKLVESRHRGSVAVFDADGSCVFSLGDVTRPVFPRSAKKLIQALPLVESGAADAYGFGDRELSLSCASHSSEPGHVELAGQMLSAAGLAESDLGCGVHWPLIGEAAEKAKIALAKSGDTPSQLHNNCSGKHAGFLCCARHTGMNLPEYLDPEHELQREIRATMEVLTGERIDKERYSFDGCSAPSYAASLEGLAKSFAKLATGQGLAPLRANSARRLISACVNEPWYMAGTNRFCTRVMKAGKGRIFAKVGAEGVYTAAIPKLGFGIAIKADDGAERACEIMLADTLRTLIGNDVDISAGINALTRSDILNWNGTKTGEIRSISV